MSDLKGLRLFPFVFVFVFKYIFSVCLVFFCLECFMWSEESLNIGVWHGGGLGLPVAVSGQVAGFSNIQF